MTGDHDFAVSAELLRRGRDVVSMVASLGESLAKALPDHVEFHRGRLSRATSLRVRLAPHEFRLELKGQRATPWIDHIVRDICVRSDEVGIDEWLDSLASALEAEAQRSTTVRLALEESLS